MFAAALTVGRKPSLVRPRVSGALRLLRRCEGITRLSLIAFVMGFLVLPCLHTANHRDDHSHGVGARARAVAHQHAHADGQSHSHDEEAPPSHEDSPAPHGAGAIEHFGLAVIAVPVFVVPPAPETLVLTSPAPLRERLQSKRQRERRETRGPPV